VGREPEAIKDARRVAEGLNTLCVLMCGPAFRKVQARAPALLRRWEAEYAPVFRSLDAPQGDTATLRSAVDKISALAAGAFDPSAPDEVTALRGAIREALTALGVALPVLSPEAAAVCELHGEDCPVLDEARC
jgi:hypothetical protein